MVVMRVIPFEVPSLEKLGLPPVLATLAEGERGLLLVVGGPASGKTSTMAALVHHINATSNRHVVTLESPIEFLHRDVNSSVTQREVGVDTDSFAVGMRAALRQDPNVIMIGEIHDMAAMDTAIAAAETGHLIIASFRATDATGAVERVTAMFPPDEQDVARARLGGALHGIVAQRLLPRGDGEGRCAAVEVLVATPEVRAAIRDAKKLKKLAELMAADTDHGMITFEQNLADLAGAEIISAETARAAVKP